MNRNVYINLPLKKLSFPIFIHNTIEILYYQGGKSRKYPVRKLKGVRPGKYKLRITLVDDDSVVHDEDFYREKEEMIEVQPGITNVLEFKY